MSRCLYNIYEGSSHRRATMAQSVERILGKDEVTGSIPVSSLDKVQSQGNGQRNTR